MNDGNEVWFPKSCVQNLQEGVLGIQNVSILDFMLNQKGYGGIIGKSDKISGIGGVCVVCGAGVDNPKYKLCKNCYLKGKEQGGSKTKVETITNEPDFQYTRIRGDWNELSNQGEIPLEERDIERKIESIREDWIKWVCEHCGYEGYARGLFNVPEYCTYCGKELKSENLEITEKPSESIINVVGDKKVMIIDEIQNYVGIRGYCRNCGNDKGAKSEDNKIYCTKCGNKVSDGEGDWVSVYYNCEKCSTGEYKPYGLNTLKCNNCGNTISLGYQSSTGHISSVQKHYLQPEQRKIFMEIVGYVEAGYCENCKKQVKAVKLRNNQDGKIVVICPNCFKNLATLNGG